MSQNLSKNLELKLEEIRDFYSRHKSEIRDIVAYGSAVRGNKPRDIDLVLILEDDVEDGEDLAYRLKRELEDEKAEVDVKGKKIGEIFNSNFLAGGLIILEGYSLITEEYICQKLNLENYTLFKYNLSNLDKNKKTQFTYALKGRGENEGVLEGLSGKHFSRGVILIPPENTGEFKDFFGRWNLSYEEYRIGMRRVI
ncbi:MAG: nucleotidyltransferase domain-containing protein [Candidatus Aenigmatarchaeota archaeon]